MNDECQNWKVCQNLVGTIPRFAIQSSAPELRITTYPKILEEKGLEYSDHYIKIYV